jgi:prophage regulatory protein
MPHDPTDRLLTIKELEKRDGKKKTWRWQMIKEGRHPKPVHIGRSARWLESEYELFIAAQIAASRTVA